MGTVTADGPSIQGAPAPGVWSQVGQGVSSLIGWYEQIARVDREREATERDVADLAQYRAQQSNPMSLTQSATASAKANPWPWLAAGAALIGVTLVAVGR